MRSWIKGLLAAAVIALLAAALISMGKFAVGFLAGIGDSSTEPDPMFAEEEILPTAAPTEDSDTMIFGDNSANWDTSVRTPVDKTAEELGREAQPQP